MRKLILLTSLLLAVHIALLFTRRSAKAEGKETSPVRIGIVLDVGGRGDKSFNDGAYAGGRTVDDYLCVKAIAPSVQIVAHSGFGRVWSLVFTGAFC